MFDWVERDSAQHPRRGIAAHICHPGMRRLVHADREQECNNLEDDDDVFEVHSNLASILPCTYVRLGTGNDRPCGDGHSCRSMRSEAPQELFLALPRSNRL